MKTTAENVPRPLEAKDTFARARMRQLLLVAAFLVVVIVSAVGFNLKKSRSVPKIIARLNAVPAPAAGMVAQVLVQKGQNVRKGELLAVLDQAHLRAELEQAQNNLMMAFEQAQATSTPVALPVPPPTLQGSFEKRPVPIPPSGTSSMQPLPSTFTKVDVVPNGKVSGKAKPMLPSRQQHNVADTKAAQAKVTILEQKLADAKDGADSAQALVISAQAAVARTKAEKDKSATLLAEGVISANEASRADSYAAQAQGQLETARVRAAAAQAALGEAQRQLEAARAELITAQKSGSANAAPTPVPAKVSQDPVASPPKMATNEPKAPAKPVTQVPKYRLVKVKSASAGPPPQPVQVDFTSPQQALQRIEKAEAELEQIQRKFAAACIYSPIAGKITRINTSIGQMIEKGSPLFIIQR